MELLVAIVILIAIIFLCLRFLAILVYLLRLSMSKIITTNLGVHIFQVTGSIFWLLSIIGFFVLDPSSRLQAFASFIAFVIGPILILLGTLLDVLKHCSWCNRRNIVFKDGCSSVTYEHVNKDGSRNRRRSSNKQYQFYVSKYECSDCGAVSEYVSKYSDNPNQYSKTVSRYLLSPGEGERAGIDLHNVIKS